MDVLAPLAMMVYLLSLALAAAPARVPVVHPAPPPIAVPPPPGEVLIPFQQDIFRPVPVSERFALDFAVASDGAVILCVARALQGRMANLGGVPTRCPAERVEPYKDATGNPVQRNVSIVTTIAVKDVK